MIRSISALIACLCLPLLARAQAPSRPNFLFIVIDDLRTQFGYYGAEGLIVEHDRLSAEVNYHVPDFTEGRRTGEFPVASPVISPTPNPPE